MKIPELCRIKPEDFTRLQQKSFELYLYFKKICDDNGLRHFITGGCLIGALREGKFLPWDDDVDVFMPREDYERLREVWLRCADNERYKYCRTSKTEYTRIQFITISDEQTTFIKQRQCDLDISHGIRLDVIPLDGCPSSALKKKTQMLWALIYSMFINGEPHTSRGKALELLSKAALLIFPGKRARYCVWRLAERRMSRYSLYKTDIAKELCVWYEVMQREYPSACFRDSVSVSFEGHDCPAPVDYDTYLKMAFGEDYMTPPPSSEQAPKHDIVFYDLDNSYKIYKGRYYCVPDEKQ